MKMKKKITAGQILKSVVSIALAIFGIVVMVLGFVGETGASGYYDYPRYVTYGADFYTDSQNATADAARNIAHLGASINNTVEQAYILVGILLFLVGMYLFACAISSAPAPAVIAPEVSNPAADNDELPEL